MIMFPKNIWGIVLNLEQDFVEAIILGNESLLSEGDKVQCTNKILEVPVGHQLLGRVVNALGNPIDDSDFPIKNTVFYPIERDAPSVMHRKSVNRPLMTGIKSIDSMVPIGKGQRELIIGDKQTGKTAIAVDTIINQKNKNVKCIYVAIGQKQSEIINIVKVLEKHDAMCYTTIVVAGAGENASLQYIAPYAGCSMGEFFRDRGEDALIIYDDLTKHAWAYRQISLLLKRPSGREAYPGDVFYLHSRLLERSSQVNHEYIKQYIKNSDNTVGSLTALPIIETQFGDVSAFIPTNVISITDGQIYLDNELFNSNIRPAINAGLSVSRIGGAAQKDIIKFLSKGIRLSLAQFRELESFMQFSTDINKETQKDIHKGKMIIEILKQSQYKPLSFILMSASLLLIENKNLYSYSIEKINNLEKKLHNFIKINYKDVLNNKYFSIKDLDKLKLIIDTFLHNNIAS